jgi:hypothetical protein
MGRKPIEDKRVQLNRYVAGATTPLLKSLAGQLGISEGEVIDRAIQTLAICESFGPATVKVPSREVRVGDEKVSIAVVEAARPKFTPPKTTRFQRRSG